MQQILILISNDSRNYLECPLMTDMKHEDRKALAFPQVNKHGL